MLSMLMRYLHNPPYLLAAATAGFFLVIPSNSFAVPIDGMTIGGSEKGLYLGVDSTLAPRDLVELGIFYADATVANVDIGLSGNIPIAVTGAGLRLSYSRFLLNQTTKSGPFVQVGISAGYLSAASDVNLEGLRYSTQSGTAVSCSNCGYLKVKTANPSISFIPSVGLVGSWLLVHVLYLGQWVECNIIVCLVQNGVYLALYLDLQKPRFKAQSEVSIQILKAQVIYIQQPHSRLRIYSEVASSSECTAWILLIGVLMPTSRTGVAFRWRWGW